MMLSGNNGILNRAGEAKDITIKEGAREQIGLEVLGALDNYGDQTTGQYIIKDLLYCINNNFLEICLNQ